MPALTAADTIRILVATDSHVGYNERDPVRGDDSWKSFEEVMRLAKAQDVDMVLLAGDLFHENKPSKKSMYQVLRALRKNCLGEKPCELELISDASEAFQGAFNHVNYEDQDINIAIPVFSIHGNHDDPSGENQLCALDLLQVSGYVNYYGRHNESDKINVKPILLQKGNTKLAMYGMSNVRDERLHRTFRTGNVTFFKPSIQEDDWFNLLSVHQNRNAHSETNYLPEAFLPDFLDLVVWGHEHECLIDPQYNPETNFHVIQPGSSVATSLCPGEAVSKYVAILSITGRDFKVEKHRLKTVRPFVMKEIILNDEPGMDQIALKEDNRTEITRYLIGLVEKLIEDAKTEWLEAQDEEDVDEETQAPLPLIRLRVEYTAPDGGKFNCENPQRFSNRFIGKVANVNDVVQFHQKKTITKRSKNDGEVPEQAVLDQLSMDTIKVEKLVKEFLTAQSLKILPQNSFGDAVSQFVDKDDKHAMEMFVKEALENQIKNLMELDQGDDDEVEEAMGQYRAKLEELFAAGHLKKNKSKTKPRPPNWDSDLDGPWADQPAALYRSDNEHSASASENASLFSSVPASRGRGRGSARSAAAPTTRKPAAPIKPAARPARGRKAPVLQEEEEEDVIMLDDDDDVDPEPARPARGGRKAPPAGARATQAKRTPARAVAAAATRQTLLAFSQAAKPARGAQELSDDEISGDDDEAFDPAPSTTRSTRRR
ncbi:MAG: meiotic recombination [Trizodia sp. TS-e1964]|nr:MAG: meiotic recombination [Trizodia sp. TS-e1964]